MKYKIRAFQAPHAVIEYSTDDDQHTLMLNVRIDRKLDGTLPTGEELDAYILSFAPQLPPVDPFAGVDWSVIEAAVEAAPPTVEQQNAVIKFQLQEIDQKSIRALREGDTARVAALEADAVTLRSQLQQLG